MFRVVQRAAQTSSRLGTVRAFATQAAEKAEDFSHLLRAEPSAAESFAANLKAAAESNKGDLRKMNASVRNFVDFASEFSAYVGLVEHPLTPPARRTALITEILDHLQVDPVSKPIIAKAVLEGKRDALKEGAEAFASYVHKKNNETVVTVSSAEKLTKEQRDKIEAKLKNVVPKGQTVIIKEHIAPNIMGGIEIFYEGGYQDLTLATAYNKIKSNTTA